MAANETLAAQSNKSATGGTGKARVLLIDDHPIVRQGLTQLI